MTCRGSGCRVSKCKRSHPLPFLSSRLTTWTCRLSTCLSSFMRFASSRHPNVAYILTGNRDHLRFVLLLDYLRRHGKPAGPSSSASYGNEDDLREDTRRHSERLCDAFLEKSLPSHAVLRFTHLSFDDILNIAVQGPLERKPRAGQGSDGERPTRSVRAMLSMTDLDRIPAEVRTFPLTTARQAQHAADRQVGRMTGATGTPQDTLEFVADICNVTIAKDGRVDARGPRVRFRRPFTSGRYDVGSRLQQGAIVDAWHAHDTARPHHAALGRGPCTHRARR